MQLKTYTSKERNIYLTGLFGQNIIFNVMAVFANFYLRDVLFIPAFTVAFILVASQVFDAITDPFMGVFVDKTKTKYGKCRPWLMGAPGIIFIFIMLSFLGNMYEYGEGASMMRNAGVVAWVTVAYVLWGIFYMAGDIPLWGITSLMTEDETHRKKLQALARAAAGVGGAIGLLGFQPIGIAIGQATGSDRTGFIIAALVFAGLGCGLYQLVGIFVKEKISPPKSKIKVADNFKMAWANMPFRRLLLSGILCAPRNLLMIVAMPLVTYYFANRNPVMMLVYMAVIGGGMFGGMFAAMMLVPWLLKRFEKKLIYNWSLLVDIVPSVALFGLFLLSVYLRTPGGLTNIWFLIPGSLIFAIKGTCMGLFMVLQTNMVNDAVDYEEYNSNHRPDGVFFSGQTFIVKIGNGICNLMYNAICGLVLFSGVNVMALQNMIDSIEETGVIPREVMQRGSEVIVHTFQDVNRAGEIISASLTADRIFWFFAAMFFCVSILPAIGSILAVIPTLRYELTDEAHQKILVALQERRRENEEAAAE